jgi:hypothetical protein
MNGVKDEARKKFSPRRISKESSTSANNYIYISIIIAYDTFLMTGSLSLFQSGCYESSGSKNASTDAVNITQSLQKSQKNETSFIFDYFPAEKGNYRNY